MKVGIPVDLLGVALIGLLYPVCAEAQSTSPSDTAKSKDNEQVEEIVVTAQKRSQRMQDVPITISTLTAQAAERMGVAGTADLGAVTPGLMFKRSSFAAAPSIRGIGSVVLSQGDESTVAIYVDGVLQVSPTVGVFSLNNIERVEVLKGPQGTLFGRNATGGVINVITKEPSNTTSVDASIGYGNYDTTEGRFYGTTGLGSNAAIDLAVDAKDQAKGWGKNLTYGTDVYKDKEINVRSRLRVNIGAETTAIFGGTFINSIDSRAGAFRLLQGTTASSGISYPGFYNVESNVVDPANHQTHYDFDMKLSHNFDWASLVSITSYQHSTFRWEYDVDGTALNLLTANVHGKDTAFTQELQLLSPKGQRLEWILGGFYLHADSVFDPALASGLGVGGTETIDGGQKTNSWAGFGQATLEILPKLRLTVGARYTADKRSIDETVSLPPYLALGEMASKTFTKFTYRVALDYKIARDVLAYASWTTGFKAGRFNTDTPGSPPILPENLYAGEAGLKTSFWNRRAQLNTSVFYYNYKDLQVSSLQGAYIEEGNAAAAHLKGVDVDLNVVPLHDVSLQAAVSYLDAKYVSYPGAEFYFPVATGGYTAEPGDAAGNDLTRAPKLNVVLAGQYRLETERGDFAFAATYNFRSKFYWDPQNSAAGTEPRENLVNGSVTWIAPDKHYEVSIWAKNMLNEEHHTYVVAGSAAYISLPSEPRTFGGTLRFRY